MRRRRKESRVEGARLFFATDVHGSDRCFRKFVNAGVFYGVQHLILGGDITGKSLVPIERTARGFSATYLDHAYVDLTDGERAALEQRIRDHGRYPVTGTRDELLTLHDEEAREQAFRRVVVEGITRWVELAEQRLRGTGIRCFVTPGNDDYWEIDEALQGSEVVEFVEGKRVSLDDRHEMITTGYSNITPWDSPRELEEPALAARIDAMCVGLESYRNLVAVIHPPPYNTDLDKAPAIDSDFRVQLEAGAPKIVPVGSTAVREFVERAQPLLGLHGHVNESRAAQLLGRTLCLNPGSEYTEGTLCGAIVTLGDGVVLSHQFVVG
jgi:Icc-related predicted phosphoesterase